MPDATAELTGASADIPLTRDAREILERAAEIASARGSLLTSPADVLNATLQLPRSLADREIQALGFDPKSIAAQVPPDGAAATSIPLRQLLVNANREAQVLGHYQVDSIHLLLAMLYSDSPATSAPLQKAGLTLYDLRRHLQTGSAAGVPTSPNSTRPDQALRRKPWPSLRGVFSVSPVFLGILAATAGSGVLLWTGLVPRLVTVWTIVFVVAGWITSLCIHEFGHAIVAYLGGDRSVAGAGYLTLNPLRYTNVTNSLILPVAFLLLGGIAMPGGAVYVNHSALRTRVWSSAVSIAGPFGTLLCGLLIAGAFTVAGHQRWITPGNVYFFAALALLGFFMALAVVLNLLPVPGFDGFGIIRPWLPASLQYGSIRYGTVAMYGTFIVLWFVAPVRDAFFQFVFQLTTLGNIPFQLIIAGQYLMRFI
jgi:Zn-dependent protease